MEKLFGWHREEDVKRPSNCGVMCFHKGTEEAVLASVEQIPAGDPAAVLRAVDEFCIQRHWMMNVGPQKGKVLAATVAKKRRPVVCAELGAYIGYSAVLVGSLLGPEDKLLALEVSAQACVWARRLVRHAGLDDRVEILNLDAGALAAEAQRRGLKIDVLFIDHDKSRYVDDLKAAEPALSDGAHVVADNVICYGTAEAYLKYVRDPSHGYVSSVLHKGELEYSIPGESADGIQADGVEVSVFDRRSSHCLAS